MILARPLHPWKVALIATMAASAVAVAPIRRRRRAASCCSGSPRRCCCSPRCLGAGGALLVEISSRVFRALPGQRPRGGLRERADRRRAEGVDLTGEPAQRPPASGVRSSAASRTVVSATRVVPRQLGVVRRAGGSPGLAQLVAEAGQPAQQVRAAGGQPPPAAGVDVGGCRWSPPTSGAGGRPRATPRRRPRRSRRRGGAAAGASTSRCASAGVEEPLPQVVVHALHRWSRHPAAS